LGTLAAFVFVCFSVMILRKKYPDMKRAFKCPGMPALPIIGIIFCLLLMLSLPLVTWAWFSIWLIIGIIIYFTYGGKKASDFPCQETLKQALDEQESENKTESI
jgi:basic amino acid/polyamine antiporter, APA family